MAPDTCCPPFDPALWDEKMFEWKDKCFVKVRVRTFFYMPVNFGKVMRTLEDKLQAAGASICDSMCLSNHTSKWNLDVYVVIDREVPALQSCRLNGPFFSKVYEGPYKDTGKWRDDFYAQAKRQNIKIGKQYIWYTTCPKCAKKYGKNYVAIFGEVK
ncbi:MAG: hypothetical protein LBV12_06640 [Puniceicoccales bacterium]|jgi:hypothetical protein|nr:hypothetical protein [Puniceicoccales bacterium]